MADNAKPTHSAALQAERQTEAANNAKAVEKGKEEVVVRNDGVMDHEYHERLDSQPSPPPVGILKKSSYVPQEDPTTDDSKQGGKKGRKAKRKLVPVWRLFRFADAWDMLMITLGTLMAVAAGLARPGNILLFGEVINQFVYYDLATNPAAQSNLTSNQTGYFCSDSSSGKEITANLLLFVNDPDATLLRQIGLYSLYYVGFAGGVFIAIYLATIFWNISAYRQTRRMRMAFYQSILRQEIGWFDVTEANELSTRLADDIDKIQAGIGDKLVLFMQGLTTFLAGFIIGYAVNWKLSLVVSVMLPFLLVIGAATAKIVATFSVREQGAYAAAGGVAEEVLSSIRTIVAFGGEEKEAERYGTQLKRARNEGLKKGFFSSLVNSLLNFVTFASFALAFWYGSVLLIDCELAAGDVVTVLLSIVLASFSLGTVLPELETFATALGSATVVFELIDRKPEIDSSSDEGEAPDNLEGNIKFSGVVFSYPARPDVQILGGIDLEMKKGQTVALVGPSGCGKSTIIQLIQQFYNPLSGQITLDGREIGTLNLQWLRSHIGVVSQEPVLFNTTIAENIRYGRQDATMDDIIQAAKNANAHDFISQLPDGYDTDVGERGAQMSGGQKQRIAIARALVRDPKILLLDEATSALDNQSEKVVQDALDKARKGRTTIVIAHRLSTIQTADVIIAISGGRVAESGSHSELMDQEGLYYELVTAQTIDEEEEQSQEPLVRFRATVRKSRRSRRSKRSFSRRSTRLSRGARESRYELASIDDQDQDALTRFRASVRQSISRSISRRSTRRRSTARSTSRRYEFRDGIKEEHDLNTEVYKPYSDEVVEAQTEEAAGVINVSQPVKERLQRVSLAQLLKLNRPDWYLVVIGVVFSAAMGCLFPLMATFFGDVLGIFGSTNPQDIEDGIRGIAGTFSWLSVVASIVFFVANFSLAIAGERLTKRLRYLSFKAMLRQEIAWFDQKVNSTGALATRLASDASQVKNVTGIRLGSVLQVVGGLIAAIAVGFSASWELTLVLIPAFPVQFLVAYFEIRLLSGKAQKNKKSIEESGQIATESIDNIDTVASLGIEPLFCSRYGHLLKGPFRSNIKGVFVQATVLALGQSLVYFLYCAGYYFGAFLVVQGRANYDDIFRVFGAVIFTAISIGQASSFASGASKAHISAAKIIALLNRKPHIDASSSEGIKLDKPSGDIAVHSVHFSYPTQENAKVLQGMSVSVKSGQTLALVGPSGCGKSTIVSLVERFYDPVTGNVTLEGTDLRDLNLSWLRRQIGIVSQEPVLFDATIAENIRYGALYRQVSDQEVIEAAKSANIHTFIESLPQGYSTNVGAKGTQLSGGQKQRIAIARAIVRNPKILLLDEATSALDTESEKVVQKALDKAREGRTTIAIAHRLSTIYNSNIIAVIHNGQVIEAGTHTQLMAKKGAYYHLNTVQDDEN